MKRLCLILTALFAVGFCDYIYFANAGDDTILAYSPVGADTASLTAVELDSVGAATTVLTVADKLYPGTVSAVTSADRMGFRLKLLLHSAASPDTLRRMFRLTWRDMDGNRNRTDVWMSAAGESVLSNLTVCKLDTAIAYGRHVSDSFGIIGLPTRSARAINSLTVATYPYVAVAQENIYPRRRGRCIQEGEGYVRIANTVTSGYTVVLDTALGKARGVMGMPDTGWVVGTALFYCAAGDSAYVNFSRIAMGDSVAPLSIDQQARDTAEAALRKAERDSVLAMSKTDSFELGLGMVGRGGYVNNGDSVAVDTTWGDGRWGDAIDPTAFHHGDTTDRNDRLYASKVETDSVISKPTSTKMVFGRGDTGVTPGTPIALDTSLVFALVAKFTGKVIANSLHGVGADVTGVNAVATGGLDTSAIFLRSMPRAGKGGFLVSTAGITTNDSQPWARIYERATKDTLVATAWQGLDSATTDAAIGGCSVSADTIITGVAGRYSIRWGLCLDTLVTVGANIGMVVKLFVAGNPYVQYGNRITPLAIGSTYWCALTGGMDIDIAASQKVYLSIYPAAGCALLGGTAATSQCYLSVRLSEN